MTGPEEQIYERGHREAWVSLLSLCLDRLGYDSPEGTAAGWIAEREAAIAKLRELCADFGDNDWDERFDLADIIDRHLGKHLYDESEVQP